MDDARMSTSVTSELIDALEQVLIGEFGLRSATEHARRLLSDDALAAAGARLQQARIDRSEAIARGATLEAIGLAGEREREAERIIAQLHAWRARERAEASLALEVFTGARSLGLAADPRWAPQLEQLPPLAGGGRLLPVHLRAP